MPHRVLLTGASGYLGGTLLTRLQSAQLPAYDKLYALVRTNSQANAVKEHGAEPLTFDVKDGSAIHEAMVKNQITIVLFMIDAMSATSQLHFIKALAEVKKSTGIETHFMHTSGAKIFSSHAGAPTDRPLYDDEADLLEIQKAQEAPISAVQPAVEANSKVIDECEKVGVHGYISVPCIVYGKGESFGNKISIQTVAVVRAARALRQVYSVDPGKPVRSYTHWLRSPPTDQHDARPGLSATFLTKRISPSPSCTPSSPDKIPPSGKQGYYLGTSGSVAWLDIYTAMAQALAKRGVTDDNTVKSANDDNEILAKMGKALDCPGALVPLMLGGLCTFTARNGQNIGWKPEYRPEHILELADNEVARILEALKD